MITTFTRAFSLTELKLKTAVVKRFLNHTVAGSLWLQREKTINSLYHTLKQTLSNECSKKNKRKQKKKT